MQLNKEQLIIMARGDLEQLIIMARGDVKAKVGHWVKYFNPHHSQKHQVHRAVGNTDQLVIEGPEQSTLTWF